jgi:hypothetical protein
MNCSTMATFLLLPPPAACYASGRVARAPPCAVPSPHHYSARLTASMTACSGGRWRQLVAPAALPDRPSAAAAEPAQPAADGEFDGLSSEEDVQVPGSYADAMNGNTRLGKAVRSACKELGTLNSLVRAHCTIIQLYQYITCLWPMMRHANWRNAGRSWVSAQQTRTYSANPGCTCTLFACNLHVEAAAT